MEKMLVGWMVLYRCQDCRMWFRQEDMVEEADELWEVCQACFDSKVEWSIDVSEMSGEEFLELFGSRKAQGGERR